MKQPTTRKRKQFTTGHKSYSVVNSWQTKQADNHVPTVSADVQCSLSFEQHQSLNCWQLEITPQRHSLPEITP